MTLGKVLEENTMVFREAVGTATDDEGKEYELTASLNGSPIVQLPNGRYVTYSWKDILNDAIETFKAYEQEKATDRREANQ